MSVTCKFTKSIQLIPGKLTMSAAQWAKALLERLLLVNWELPEAIISDRDRKFLSENPDRAFQISQGFFAILHSIPPTDRRIQREYLSDC